jgi:hypothetical protein
MRAPTHLCGHVGLERSVLLDLLALLFSGGLALVDHAGDAGNAVLGNCQPHFPSSHVITTCMGTLTLAMGLRMCYGRRAGLKDER